MLWNTKKQIMYSILLAIKKIIILSSHISNSHWLKWKGPFYWCYCESNPSATIHSWTRCSKMLLHTSTFFQYGLFTKETEHDNQFLNLFWRQNFLSAQTSLTVDTTPYILLPLMMCHTYHLPIDCNFTLITVTSKCWWMEQLKFICILDTNSYNLIHQKGFQSC